MRAVKENRRPPLTTLATRLTLIVRSSYCVSWAIALEHHSGFTGRVGDCGDASVAEQPAPVEDDPVDACGLGPLADEAADRRGRGLVAGAAPPQVLLVGGGGG